MMDNKGLKASRVCSLVLQGKCGDWEILNNWEIEVPPGKPEPEEPTLPSVIKIINSFNLRNICGNCLSSQH